MKERPFSKKKISPKCLAGFHDYESFIDPNSGGFIRCKDCGHEVDCEDPDGDLG